MRATTNGRTVSLSDKPRWYQRMVRMIFALIYLLPLLAIAGVSGGIFVAEILPALLNDGVQPPTTPPETAAPR